MSGNLLYTPQRLARDEQLGNAHEAAIQAIRTVTGESYSWSEQLLLAAKLDAFRILDSHRQSMGGREMTSAEEERVACISVDFKLQRLVEGKVSPEACVAPLLAWAALSNADPAILQNFAQACLRVLPECGDGDFHGVDELGTLCGQMYQDVDERYAIQPRQSIGS